MRILLRCEWFDDRIRGSETDLLVPTSFSLRLTKLNEEIGAQEQGGSGNDETYVDVMKDFSNFAINQPHRLQRPKVEESEEI